MSANESNPGRHESHESPYPASAGDVDRQATAEEQAKYEEYVTLMKNGGLDPRPLDDWVEYYRAHGNRGQIYGDDQEEAATLSERILEEITNRPGQSAADIAKTLGVSRKDVTLAIYGDLDLYGALEHDCEFHWRPKEKSEPAPDQQEPAADQQERRRCERCSRPIETKGNRYCDDCTAEILGMMHESGYVEPRPFRRKPRPYEARENTWETKGGSGDRF